MTVSGIDYEKMLAELSGNNARDWIEIDGPDSGCGVDRWFVNSKVGSESYINDDQGFITIELDGEVVIQSDEGETWFDQFRI